MVLAVLLQALIPLIATAASLQASDGVVLQPGGRLNASGHGTCQVSIDYSEDIYVEGRKIESVNRKRAKVLPFGYADLLESRAVFEVDRSPVQYTAYELVWSTKDYAIVSFRTKKGLHGYNWHTSVLLPNGVVEYLFPPNRFPIETWVDDSIFYIAMGDLIGPNLFGSGEIFGFSTEPAIANFFHPSVVRRYPLPSAPLFTTVLKGKFYISTDDGLVFIDPKKITKHYPGPSFIDGSLLHAAEPYSVSVFEDAQFVLANNVVVKYDVGSDDMKPIAYFVHPDCV